MVIGRSADQYRPLASAREAGPEARHKARAIPAVTTNNRFIRASVPAARVRVGPRGAHYLACAVPKTGRTEGASRVTDECRYHRVGSARRGGPDGRRLRQV